MDVEPNPDRIFENMRRIRMGLADESGRIVKETHGASVL